MHSRVPSTGMATLAVEVDRMDRERDRRNCGGWLEVDGRSDSDEEDMDDARDIVSSLSVLAVVGLAVVVKTMVLGCLLKIRMAVPLDGSP